MTVSRHDAIIIGGGPAGSTAGSILARAGHRVLLLERTTFPRYQIGESLLLATWDIFDALGVRDRIANAGFVRKPGATFVWGNEEKPWSVYFSELNGRQADSRNVERSVFDKILLDRSVELGVDVRYQANVNEVVFEEGRATGVDVTIDGHRQTLPARYVIDASGRESKITKSRVRRYRPDDFKGAAIWTYFHHVERLPEPNAGNILYAMFAWGWFWVIPLADGVTSVGVVMNPPKFKEQVAQVNGTKELYEAAVASCPILADMLVGAERIEDFRVCADYSLDSERYYGEGFLIVGDAACFIDPILSTGVHLAMTGGLLAGLALNTVFESNSEEPLTTFEELYRREYKRLLKVSRQQYELNKNCGDRFWSAHRVIEPGRDNPSFDVDRQAFISLIAGQSAREHVLDLQKKDGEEMFMKYGPGRFDHGPAFLEEHLSIATGRLEVSRGYKRGSVEQLTFVKDELIATADGSRLPVNAADIELLSLCDGRRTVEGVVEDYRRGNDLEAIHDEHLRRSLGYWVDQGVLCRSTQGAAPETSSVF